MDIVTDLTSQAVSGITIVQKIVKTRLKPSDLEEKRDSPIWKFSGLLKNSDKELETNIQSIQDVLWCSIGVEKHDTYKECFTMLADELLLWLKEYNLPDERGDEQNKKEGLALNYTLSCTPYQWRSLIRRILYHKPSSRPALARAIHYMPVQVILCLNGKDLSQAEQRLYQAWNIAESSGLLKHSDWKDYRKWWEGEYIHPGGWFKSRRFEDEQERIAYQDWWQRSELNDKASREHLAEKLLQDDTLLRQWLKWQRAPLPFETFFNAELDEIDSSRKLRRNENAAATQDKPYSHENRNIDPMQRAVSMELHGLALSGGGIRSATFSLGVLQKLAEEGKLQRYDYLSSVSGGGYIGTWLATWIKRGGSVSAIIDKLNVKRSADPLGDEVRPIRWLRMFSNYLAPDAGIMSADSWTMGITWLRNTLINQMLLLLLLCTALSAVADLFFTWGVVMHIAHKLNFWHVFIWSFVVFAPGVLFTGWGMKTYDQPFDERMNFSFGRIRWLSLMLVTWATIVAFAVSSWLYQSHHAGYMYKVWHLWPASLMGFFGMVVIAYIGKYQRCAQRPVEKQWVHAGIVLSSAVSSATGLFLLAGAWELFYRMFLNISDSDSWVFIIGPPIILECISACVIMRMALMGKLFPDERREWWGRMGAITHRAMLFWILATAGALELPKGIRYVLANWPHIQTVLGISWVAVVGAAVKMAYQSKDNQGKSGSSSATIQDMFIRFAPYLFMIGFLFIGACTFDALSPLLNKVFPAVLPSYRCLVATAILGAVTLLFSWRVGVNEFSLHHFYRNRLVRAYMGASRKRTDRDKTMNSFTGFDKNDDIKLSRFINQPPENVLRHPLESDGGPYFGPYPILNATLNATGVSELDRQDRKGESFIFSPLYCGFDFSPTRSAAYAKNKVYEYGYRPTERYGYEKGPKIGTAMAISGAAVSPNMGYHSSPATAFMLTMFNVRLGWWMGNPRRWTYKYSDPGLGVIYMVNDLAGKSDIDSLFVYLSDGGHFDNMGLYELIRRRCRHITLVDAEEDPDNTFEGLANAIRRCRIDYGVEIAIDTGIITGTADKDGKKEHRVDGTIHFPGDPCKSPSGTITYIKANLTSDETTDIREYKKNNDVFPQQPTGDQFFTEEQFESYRKLGYLSV